MKRDGLGMITGTMDRRVFRTRGALQHAFTALISEKGYEAITITDICRAAGVGRSTFYAHYADKDDLKRRCFEHLRKQLAGHQREALAAPGDARDRFLAFSLGMFEHGRDHLDWYRALVGGRGGEVALGTIREVLSDLARNELSATADGIPRELTVQFVVGAYMAVLTWWLDGGAKLPPREIDAMFRRLATKGVTP